MRICCLGMVKNEADIIEAFVRHTLRFADQICLLENGSTDGTREILAELQREGLPLTVIEDPIIGYFQAEKMTWLYRRAVPLLKPDFVLLLDADEFLAAPDRAALEAALGTIRAGRYGALRWRNYVLRPEEMDTADGDPPRRIRHHLLPEHDNGQVKAVVRCDHAPPEQMVIHQGNHAIGTVDPALAPRRTQLWGLALAHYPVRSLEQVRQKVLVGWLAYAERNRLAEARPFGRHWQFGFEAMIGDDATARAAALAMNLRYGRLNQHAKLDEVLVEAPLDVAYELRFPLRRPSVLRTLMHAFAKHLRMRPGAPARPEAWRRARPWQPGAARGRKSRRAYDAAPPDAPAEARRSARRTGRSLPPRRPTCRRSATCWRATHRARAGTIARGPRLADARDGGVARCIGVDPGPPPRGVGLPPGSLRRATARGLSDLRESFDCGRDRPRSAAGASRGDRGGEHRPHAAAPPVHPPWPVTRCWPASPPRLHPTFKTQAAPCGQPPVLRHGWWCWNAWSAGPRRGCLGAPRRSLPCPGRSRGRR